MHFINIACSVVRFVHRSHFIHIYLPIFRSIHFSVYISISICSHLSINLYTRMYLKKKRSCLFHWIRIKVYGFLCTAVLRDWTNNYNSMMKTFVHAHQRIMLILKNTDRNFCLLLNFNFFKSAENYLYYWLYFQSWISKNDCIISFYLFIYYYFWKMNHRINTEDILLRVFFYLSSKWAISFVRGSTLPPLVVLSYGTVWIAGKLQK